MKALKTDLARHTFPQPHDAGWKPAVRRIVEPMHVARGTPTQREAFEVMYSRLYPVASSKPGKFATDLDDYTDTTVQVAWTFYRMLDPTALKESASKVADHFRKTDGRGQEITDGPGHCHRTPGVWGEDNTPALAGHKCEWCTTWNSFKAAVDKV